MEEIVFIGSPSVKLYRILARYEKDCYYIGFAQWKKYFLKENFFYYLLSCKRLILQVDMKFEYGELLQIVRQPILL